MNPSEDNGEDEEEDGEGDGLQELPVANIAPASESSELKEVPDLQIGPTPKDEETSALIRGALLRSPFFTCLDEQQLQRFVEYAQLKAFTAGDTIILEGCLDNITHGSDNRREGESKDSASQVNRRVESTDTDDAPFSESIENLEEDAQTKGQEQGMMPTQEGNDYDSNTGEGESNESDIAERNVDQEKPVNEQDEEDRDEIGIVTIKAPRISTDDLAADTTQEYTTEDGMFWAATSNQQSASGAPLSTLLEPPQPPSSGIQSFLYIIRKGQADVMYSNRVSPASLGPGTVVGEGGFLFGRQHSASVVAAPSGGTVECWVVDVDTFRRHVLPSDNMTQLYQQYATHYDEKNEEKYMTMQDFIQSCLQDNNEPENGDVLDRIDEEASAPVDGPLKTMQRTKDPLVSVRIANTFQILQNHNNQKKVTSRDNNNGLFALRITLADFCLFHLLMARPDPEVDITFALMDVRKRGVLYKDDVDNFLKSSLDKNFYFDMNSEFICRHFGCDNANNDSTNSQQRGIRPNQFSQFLVDLRREIGQQAFLQELKRSGTPEGYLTPANFVRILKTACGWRLPDGVADRLESVYCKNSIHHQVSGSMPLKSSGTETLKSGHPLLGDHYFSYCDFLAFQEVLGQLPGVCNLIDRACEIKKGPVSADDFKVINRALGMGGRLSRRQVDIIFQLFDLDKDGFVSYEDTVSVAGIEIAQRLDAVAGHKGKLTFAPPTKFRHIADVGAGNLIGSSLVIENFSLGAFASAVGVVAMYPLDLCKTRIMNQRTIVGGQSMYRHSLDCLKQTFRGEGFWGLYRGLAPQVLGFGAEKIIKMAVYDLVRDAVDFTDRRNPDSQPLDLCLDMVAGGCAGACQLLVTNPAEILKIRLQVQGETARVLQSKGFGNPVPQSLTKIANTLGYSGLFTGARACLLRDIPFSAIYFPTYVLCKDRLVIPNDQPSRSISASSLLLAGSLAGVPASLMTTPADVIKTRLQTIPRPGESSYNGIRDCFTKVYEKEGPAAFFKGSAVRVARISPQFGLAALVYEQASQMVGYRGLLRPTNFAAGPNDYRNSFWASAISKKPDDADRLLRTLGSSSLKPSSSEDSNNR